MINVSLEFGSIVHIFTPKSKVIDNVSIVLVLLTKEKHR